jgi:O-antigen/teichoic acid export membrane protein
MKAAPTTLEERSSLDSVAARVVSWLPGLLQVPARRLQASSLGRRVARGAFWTLVGATVGRMLSLAASIVTARWLGTAAFGELGLVQTTVGMFGVLAGMGLGLTATKHVAELRVTEPERAGRILTLSTSVAIVSGLVMATLMVVLSGWLAQWSPAAPHLSGLLRVGALLILLGALNGAQLGALSGFEAFRTMARINLYTGLAGFPLAVAGVWLGGLTGAVWAMVATQGLNCFLNHRALRAEARQAGVPLGGGGASTKPLDTWRVLWDFSLPAMLCSVMILPVNWAGMVWLVKQPGGFEQMGLFSAANQWRTAILFVPQALAVVALPALAGLDPVAHARRYAGLFWGNVALVGGVALVLALAVIGGAGWILESYGHNFAAGHATLVLLSLAAVVMAVNQVLGADVIRQGRMWPGLICNAIWAVLFLWLASRWVPTDGARGLALAIFCSYPVHSVCLLCLNLMRRSPNHPNPQPVS